MRARDGGLTGLVWADVPFYVFVMEFFKHLLFRNIVFHFYFKLEFSVNNSTSFKVTAKFVLFYRVFVNGELVNQCANFCCHSSVSFWFCQMIICYVHNSAVSLLSFVSLGYKILLHFCLKASCLQISDCSKLTIIIL